MYKEPNCQASFFGSMIYDRIIPESHFLKQLSRVVDFSFVNTLGRDLYCSDNGRAGWEPALMFKTVFLQFLYDISDREVEEQLTIIDSTHIAAKVDLCRWAKEHKKDTPAEDYIDKNAPDPDARFGPKTKKKTCYGYKMPTGLAAASEIITALETTAGNESDDNKLPKLMRGPPEEVTADKAYDANDNHDYLSEEKIKSSIIIKQNRTDPLIIGLGDKVRPEPLYQVA